MAQFGLQSLPEAIRTSRPVDSLVQNLRRGRMPHALILRGPDLQALEAVALGLAADLFQSKLEPAHHPDLFCLRPSGKSRQIPIGKLQGSDQPNTMRQLLRDLQKTSNQGGFKVALIYEADRMHPTSANAFLKTLEEPPRQTVIVLLTTRPYDLLPTIRSRCFQFHIDSLSSHAPIEGWPEWIESYREWIRWLHARTEEVRRNPDRAIIHAYGLISQFAAILDRATSEALDAMKKDPTTAELEDDAAEAAAVGKTKGVRDRLLLDIEEATRLAALELSHQVPFPDAPLVRAIAELESITGLLALNMKDEAALESFFIRSLRIWAQ